MTPFLPQMIHPLLPKWEVIFFLSYRVSYSAAAEKLSAIFKWYACLYFTNVWTSLFRIAPDESRRCLFLLLLPEMQPKSFISKWMKTLLLKQVSGMTSKGSWCYLSSPACYWNKISRAALIFQLPLFKVGPCHCLVGPWEVSSRKDFLKSYCHFLCHQLGIQLKDTRFSKVGSF